MQKSENKPSWGNVLLDAGIPPSNPWEYIATYWKSAQLTYEIAKILAGQTGLSIEFFLNMQDGYNMRLVAELNGWRPGEEYRDIS